MDFWVLNITIFFILRLNLWYIVYNFLASNVLLLFPENLVSKMDAYFYSNKS